MFTYLISYNLVSICRIFILINITFINITWIFHFLLTLLIIPTLYSICLLSQYFILWLNLFKTWTSTFIMMTIWLFPILFEYILSVFCYWNIIFPIIILLSLLNTLWYLSIIIHEVFIFLNIEYVFYFWNTLNDIHTFHTIWVIPIYLLCLLIFETQ